MLSKTDPNLNAIDLMLQARQLLTECLVKGGLEDSAANACLEKLTLALNEMAMGLKEIFEDLIGTSKSTKQNLLSEATTEAAQTAASQSEIDKLKKRLSQIETDLEEKDKTLLEQETQMLALTDQVEASQKLQDGLRQRIAESEEQELRYEEGKAKLLG